MIANYVAPTMSTRTVTKVQLLELQTLKQDKSVTTVTRGKTRTMAGCDKSILRRVREFKENKVTGALTNELTKGQTAPIPTSNQRDASQRGVHELTNAVNITQAAPQ